MFFVNLRENKVKSKYKNTKTKQQLDAAVSSSITYIRELHSACTYSSI